MVLIFISQPLGPTFPDSIDSFHHLLMRSAKIATSLVLAVYIRYPRPNRPSTHSGAQALMPERQWRSHHPAM
ncbi:hypothetical protein KCP76_25180 [Salmonella enterica subsp. enterica serovar Weltevreden]|nr:hypothetical protein KCP76_25180 [Salmonella enterica subsp. enterica serovar Weltevreden]